MGGDGVFEGTIRVAAAGPSGGLMLTVLHPGGASVFMLDKPLPLLLDELGVAEVTELVGKRCSVMCVGTRLGFPSYRFGGLQAG